MPTPLRRRLRFARRTVAYSGAVLLVLLAVALGVASQVLPMAERNPERIAAWLSQRAGRPVAFDKVETQWTRRGPLLRLDNLRVGEGAQAFVVGDTEMLVSIYAGLLPGHSFSELRLRGLDLTLERADDGRWKVRGLPGQEQPARDPLSALEGLGELQVIDGKLAVIAPKLGVDARIPRINLRLRVDGDRVRAGLRAWPGTGVAGAPTSPLDAALDFDRKRGDGRAYAGARRADLSAWTALLQVAGIGAESGQGRAEAWAELRGHRVDMVTVDAALDRVALRGAALADGSVPRVAFERVETRARWRLDRGGWRLDAPRLRIGGAPKEQVMDGLVVAGGERYALLADRIDAGPLLQAAALSDRVPAGLRRWLRNTQPQLSLQRIAVSGRRDGPLRASARIDGLGFAAVGTAPGLSGLAGDIEADGDGFSLRLDPASKFRFDWPAGFGVVHNIDLDGTVAGWREGAGWRIGTHSLAVKGEGYGAHARGGLWWQGDGSRPWIDIAADLDEASVPAAKGFWIRHQMPPTVVKWLDSALQGGSVRGGRAIVSGDLDDWPFRDRNGRFEATAKLHQAVVKFQSDWPAAENLDADVAFIADGFSVDGTAKMGGVGIQHIQAGIDHYRDGALTVRAQAASDAAQLLSMLRQSPLQKQHADTFANLTASGPARVDFDMNLPLRRGSVTAISGAVELQGAKLADARWKLAFDDVRGRAEYARGGFGADDLDVRHEGQAGKLSLRAGDYVRDRGNVFEAAMDASVGAQSLLDRAPEMAWLKPYVDGRSNWTVGISIPRSAPGASAPTLLQLRSNLAGTALSLPAPLHKPAAAVLPTTVETPLPVGSGDIRVGFGNVMALRARSGNGRTGVRVVLGASRVDEAPPAHGLIATGKVGALDAIEWVTLAHGDDRDGGGMPLQRIDVSAQKLQLLGGVFADTRLVIAPAPRGALAVRAEGPSLQGAVLIAADTREPLAGRFDRVYWRVPAAPAAAAASTAAPAASATSNGIAVPAAAAVDNGIAPSQVPPLTIDIADLRLGDARMGSARVRTRPTATGMRIEQIQTRADKQAIDLSGDWTGRGASARTHLLMTIDTGDAGALLDGFGFGGRVGGGKAKVRFDAAWPGSPAAFALGTMEGNLHLDARDGRLLEVEPGTGRVIGLLSIAQLPRRLTLDFRDFFSKGFAFNKVAGNVRFGAGSARSDDLVIDGPAAAINIRGSTNLRAQSYDQTVEVRPKTGNLLTAVGAIAAGPVGAAIGAAAGTVLQKPLSNIGAKTYRVTGPWKEPKVEVMTREQSRAADAAASGGSAVRTAL
ncbi:YhdP family protein [Lysobacter silvisoli]|uniref:TIGR02099 family protein n=1 Tax=Lysobacter silvisoli TaxID=2293254 RepID=A0A371K531_9GAMM|nr:YhdP family protein [Lysobacter silvisoli]RDZ29039.1 TIGR02099 family protein [Lysobacter silvisoli]